MKKYKSLTIGAIIAVFSFVISYFGTNYVNGRDITDNILAYVVLAAVLGTISAVFHHYGLKYSFYIFTTGIAVGFFEMFRSFMSDLNGWEELAGVISLMFWLVVGFLGGIAVQIIVWLYKKYKK